MSTTDLDLQHDTRTDIAVADREAAAGALAHILGTGDIALLSPEQKVAMYLDLCASLSLNPRSRPFEFIEFFDPETRGKKMVLYPTKSCAEQLRRQHQISVKIVRREVVGDLFVVEAEGRTPTGRTGEASKYVPVVDKDGQRLRGQRLASAYMKAETGCFRRLTFSMVGMASPPDPDELQRARVVVVDGRGNVIDNPTEEQRYLAETPTAARAIGEPTFESVAERWPEGSTAFDGMPDQRVRPDELVQPKPPAGPPPSFKHSDEDVTRWRGAWFATVHGLSLDSDAARAAFVAQWTADEWPKAKRCDSLTTMFKRCTKEEASDFLSHVRALMEDERRSLLEDAQEVPERGRSGDRVRDAFVLTGASDDQPERPAF